MVTSDQSTDDAERSCEDENCDRRTQPSVAASLAIPLEVAIQQVAAAELDPQRYGSDDYDHRAKVALGQFPAGQSRETARHVSSHSISPGAQPRR